MTRHRPAVSLLAAAAVSLTLYAADNDWPVTGGDPGGQRHLRLTRITAANVASLKQAWTFDTGSSNLQVTPSSSAV